MAEGTMGSKGILSSRWFDLLLGYFVAIFTILLFVVINHVSGGPEELGPMWVFIGESLLGVIPYSAGAGLLLLLTNPRRRASLRLSSSILGLLIPVALAGDALANSTSFRRVFGSDPWFFALAVIGIAAGVVAVLGARLSLAVRDAIAAEPMLKLQLTDQELDVPVPAISSSSPQPGDSP